MTRRRHRAYGHIFCVANVPHLDYQIDLTFIQLPGHQQYDTAMVRVDAFSKYAAVIPIQGKSENDLAPGILWRWRKPPLIIDTDGVTGIRHSVLLQTYFDDRSAIVHYTKVYPAFAEREFSTFESMFDNQIKPGQQWALPITPTLLTYNNKLVHSATERTPQATSKQDNQLNVYANPKLKAKHSHRYPRLV